MENISEYHQPVLLKNGDPATVRAIRPDDRDRIRAAFEKLGPKTLLTRFFTAKATLTEEELTEVTEVDFDDTVALVATLPLAGDEQIIAGARYMAYQGGDGERVAEVAFTVEDNFQGQGLASRMLACLIDIARSQGIKRFEAEVLPQNIAMLTVFDNSGLVQQRRREEGSLLVSLEL